MNVEEKRKKRRDFINSEKFTNGTYGVLFSVNQNIHRIINLVQVYDILLKKVESGDIKLTFSNEMIIEPNMNIIIYNIKKLEILSKVFSETGLSPNFTDTIALG